MPINATDPHDNSYQAAFSQVDITPDFQVELIGCRREDNRSYGVLHPLMSQVLLIRHDGQIYCLITIDSLGLTVKLADELRTRVAGLLNTDISYVMLNFSHTHAAPAPIPFALNGERYFDYMCRRIMSSVEAAKANYLPCKAGWALTETSIGENRRDGCRIVDNRLGALKLADFITGRPIVVILRITAHANVLMNNSDKISSDYFGVAREKLRSCFSCPVMLVQGAAGNVKPIGVHKIHGGNPNDLDIITDILLDSEFRKKYSASYPLRSGRKYIIHRLLF